MDLKTLKRLFQAHKESKLFGRYINGDNIAPLLKKLNLNFKLEIVGNSVLGEPIHLITIGSGSKNVFMWSQMHGNESTTTKAIFDLCNVCANSDENAVKQILSNCTIHIIPILNPDGAKMYTRLNANDIDLNRDAQDLSQPESICLRDCFEKIKPNVCFNLHGQRTIFSAGTTNNPATVSFLAPAQDEARSITKTRQKAMEVIILMNDNLQAQIPHQVGIYDDAFNLKCVGDTFQSLEVPTVLFEAGHFPDDYNREIVREYIFQSMLLALEYISSKELTGYNYKSYFNIPQNEKLFYDFIIRNAKVGDRNVDLAVQYKELLIGDELKFIPVVEKISDLTDFYGHKEVDANSSVVLTHDKQVIYEGYENDFVLLNNEVLSFKL